MYRPEGRYPARMFFQRLTDRDAVALPIQDGGYQ